MYLVTLEGLPHAARARIVRILASACPSWTCVDLHPDQAGTSCWTSPSSRAGHSLFASLIQKLNALARCPEGTEVVLLSCPWFEHLPRQPCVWSLMQDATRELVAHYGCRVKGHVMVMLQVPPNEAFEHMVSQGHPYWNDHNLADVSAIEHRVWEHLCGLHNHPFPHVAFRVSCPPFVEENEVLLARVAMRVADAVRQMRSDETV